MRISPLHTALTFAMAGHLLFAQQPIMPVPQSVPPQPSVLPPGGIPALPPPPKPTPAPAPVAQPAQPNAAAQPAPPVAAQSQNAPAQTQPPPTSPSPAPAPAAPAANATPSTPAAPLFLTNASLTVAIDLIAKELHLNVILDPRVKGSVNINTYGEIRSTDLRPLLETLLRMNGFQMVQVGNMYRIVPVSDAARLPVRPQNNASNIPDDESLLLNLVFLKYVTAGEMAKLLEPFNGEGSKMIPYEPANLLLLLDNSRNMKRTMDLISMFDSDSLAGQRVRAFTVTNGRPSDIAKDLENVFKSYALSEKSASVKFLPIDRINTVIAIAPNPGTFTRVEEWIKKLDVETKITAGSIDNHVYRFKYGRAEIIGPSISQLYGSASGGVGGGYGQGQFGNLGATGVSVGGQFGSGSIGNGSGGFGSPAGGGFGGGAGAVGGSPMGGVGAGVGSTGGIGGSSGMNGGVGAGGMNGGVGGMNGANGMGGNNLTGSYLGMQGLNALPRIIPNPYDNTLLIQSTPEQWAQISKLLEQLDVPPRQVLIDAKIYEVSLTGDLQYGVTSYLQQKGSNQAGFGRQLLGAASSTGINLTGGILAGQGRELMAALTAADLSGKTKLVASPSIIATDSIAAAITVGTEVPTLQSQAVTGIQSGGSSLFANTIATRNTGLTLGILARINASGIVTLVVNEEYSQPEYPSTGAAIQSPSFSKRNVSTQVTVQDGDTIAIGGMVQEDSGVSNAGIPGLNRLPWIGGVFGSKHFTSSRSELIVFLTPRVIYDTNQIVDATQEIKERMNHLRHLMKDQ